MGPDDCQKVPVRMNGVPGRAGLFRSPERGSQAARDPEAQKGSGE